MAERSLRGRSIGAKSLESENGVPLADRKKIVYVCPKGHRTIVPFAAQATVPTTWFCHCGLTCVQEDRQGDPLEGGKAKRSHYDMLLERRTEKELQELLARKIEEHEMGGLSDYD
ncbi:MAG: RNA polymerase-binding protein RbpA [Aeriscardovia sp.]|nr:RNA polymerase-binding protein RbpA [Aeriscardovia sp.]MBO7717803.1 RNA polymerase-binding protein RbpA [Aeriscardovia sp.]